MGHDHAERKPKTHSAQIAIKPSQPKPKRQQATERMARAEAERAKGQAAASVMYAAADVLKNASRRLLAGAPVVHAPALWMLHAAVTGKRDGEKLDGGDRLKLLEVSGKLLRGAADAYAVDPDQEVWLEEQFWAPMVRWHADLEVIAAYDRVASSALIDAKQVHDSKLDDDPRAQGQSLRAQMTKVLGTLHTVTEWVARYHASGIELAIKDMIAEKMPPHHRRIGSIVQLQTLLELGDGLLILTDEAFAARLADARSLGDGIANYAQLVKAMVALIGGTVALSIGAVGFVAKLTGNASTALAVTGLARHVSNQVSNLVSAIEVVYGFARLLDSSASRQERIDGAVQATSGLLWLASSKVAVAGPASFALSMGYLELRLALDAYWGSSAGLVTGLMRPALERLHRDAIGIAHGSNTVIKAQLLAGHEQDPMERAALERVLVIHARRLGETVDRLITDALPPALEAGMANSPGAYPILREALAPVSRHHGARTPDAAVKAAAVALERISWVLSHAQEILLAQTKREGMAEAEGYARDNDKRRKEAERKRMEGIV